MRSLARRYGKPLLALLGMLCCTGLTGPAAAAPVVLNPTFDGTAGYGPIAGWTQVPMPSGLPGYGYLSGSRLIMPFANLTFASFGAVQVYGSAVPSLGLTQLVSGFVTGLSYQLSYYESSRACCSPADAPLVQVTVDGNAVVASHAAGPAGSWYQVVSTMFVATSSSESVTFLVSQSTPGVDEMAGFSGVTIVDPPANVREPPALALLGVGVLGLCATRRGVRGAPAPIT
jgi:hypothetical protein